MVWRLLLAAMMSCAMCLGGGLMLAGCGSLELGARGRGFGVEFEIYVNAQGKKQAKLTGSLPPGICVKVVFVDSSGNPVGTVVAEVPGDVDVPEGATNFGLDFVDCRAPGGAPNAGMSGSKPSAGHQGTPFQWHELSYWSIDPDLEEFNPWSNTTASVRLRLPAGVDPLDGLLAVIAAGPGAITGPDVEIEYFAQMMPSSGGARLLVADDEPIVDFSLSWNGNAHYADLTSSNVTQYSAANGWSVVQTVIPSGDFALGQFSWNGGTVSVQSASAQTPTTVYNEFQTLTP